MRLRGIIIAGVALIVIALWFHRPTTAYLLGISREVAANQRQLELVQIDDRLKQLKTKLVVFMSTHPSFARVRIALIHTAIVPDGSFSLQWSIAASLAAPDRMAGDFVQDQPLGIWDDYLGLLLHGHCSFTARADVQNISEIDRMKTMNIAAFLVCPILNSKHQLKGGVFVSWDNLADVPVNIIPTELATRDLAATVAGILRSTE